MELRAVLPPALANQIDFSTLETVPGTFVDERMRGSHADLLHTVQCAGKETLVYVLLEHKSEVDRWTLLQLLRYSDGRREGRILDELLTWADLFRAVLATQNGQRAILQLFSYLSRVAPSLGPEELAERIQRAIPERNDIVSTLAEKWIEEGEKKGRKEGRRDAVRRLIELKFGTLDSAAAARIDAANETDLERCIERVLTATTVDGVLGD